MESWKAPRAAAYRWRRQRGPGGRVRPRAARLQRHEDGDLVLAGEPLAGRQRRHVARRVWVQVFLEHLRLEKSRRKIKRSTFDTEPAL